MKDAKKKNPISPKKSSKGNDNPNHLEDFNALVAAMVGGTGKPKKRSSKQR